VPPYKQDIPESGEKQYIYSVGSRENMDDVYRKNGSAPWSAEHGDSCYTDRSRLEQRGYFMSIHIAALQPER
jgi:hypothetical protein